MIANRSDEHIPTLAGVVTIDERITASTERVNNVTGEIFPTSTEGVKTEGMSTLAERVITDEHMLTSTKVVKTVERMSTLTDGVKTDEPITTQSMPYQRLLLSKQVCKNKIMLRGRTVGQLPTLLVDDKHKLLYCLLPKSGSSNWNRIMLGLGGRFNMTAAMNLSDYYIHTQSNQNRLANYSQAEITHKLKYYTKFMFVREPMERLVSAYKDKFSSSSVFYRETIGKYIIKAHRVNASDESLKRGHDVTFSEFVRFLLTQNKLGNPLDWHWDLQSRVCKPCLVDYDFIGKQETFTEDIAELFKMTHIENVFIENNYKSKNTTSDSMQQTFADITDREKRQLIEMYFVDYTMFGYPAPRV